MEQTVIYNNLSNASGKFSYPAFAMSKGYPGLGPGVSMAGVGTMYLVGQPTTVAGWYRHPSTIDLDEVRCPSFSGDAPSTFPTYSRYAMANQTVGVMVAGQTPKTPWYASITTNYKAMSATHMACMQNPNSFSGAGANPGTLVEAPNGIIVPPTSASVDGCSARSVTDGMSKTIMLAESKEQAYSSWYDGTLAWVTATPIDANTTLYNTSTVANRMPLQPIKFNNTLTTGTSYITWILMPGGVTAMNYGQLNTSPQLNYANLSGAFSGAFPSLVTAAGGNAWRYGPSSDHSGGFVLHAWGDAHVSALPQDTDPSIYVQLCTRAGKEAVSDPTAN